MKRGSPQPLVHARSLNAGRMQNRDHIAYLSALKVLVAAGAGVQKETAGRIGEKSVRPDFRVHRLCEHVTECQPEDISAQVIDVGDGASIAPEGSFGIQPDFSAALALAVQD